MADPIAYLEKPVGLRDLQTALARARGDTPSSAPYSIPPIGLMRVPTLVSLGINPLDWKSAPMTNDMSAKEKREIAARARRLAQGLPQDSDRERLLQYANDLDLQAEAMERQPEHHPAPSAVHDAGRQHEQQQQQQQSEPPNDGQPCKPTPNDAITNASSQIGSQQYSRG